MSSLTALPSLSLQLFLVLPPMTQTPGWRLVTIVWITHLVIFAVVRRKLLDHVMDEDEKQL